MELIPRRLGLICPIAVILLSISVYNVNAEQPIVAPKVQLSDGNSIPALGLGTARALDAEIEQAIKDAIDIGYRHIDTAFAYRNEKSIGKAIRAKIDEGVIKREDLYVTTKLWGTFHEPNQVARAFQKSLDNLNISYVDLYLMHNPVAYQRISKKTGLPTEDIDDIDQFPRDANGKTLSADVDYLDTWKAMEELMKTNKVRSLGVSNFNSQQLDRLLASATIRPVVNQVECHPNLNQKKLIAFSNERNITTVGYSPLGQPKTSGDKKIAIKDTKVQEIATKYKKNPGQVVLRYSYQNGVVVIPKSTNKERIRGNIDIFDFNLSDEEMASMDKLNDNNRIVWFTGDEGNKYYPFNIEF